MPAPGPGPGFAGAAALLLAAGLVACGGSTPASGPGAVPAALSGHVLDRPVPEKVARLQLQDQDGRAVTLASLKGKVVVLASFLTACQDECPLTTGALVSVQRAIAAAGLGADVAVVEATVDPERDTPDRLAAYSRLFGAAWTLVTGTPSDVSAFWSFFGVWVEKTPPASPPGTDWFTQQPYTYGIAHTDALFLLGRDGHERAVLIGSAGSRLPIPPWLEAQMTAGGHRHTVGAEPSWTPDDVRTAVSWLAGRPVPAAPAA